MQFSVLTRHLAEGVHPLDLGAFPLPGIKDRDCEILP